MTRLGSQKVRTGCKTCKIRKVKCDETWPQCLKCKKAGRPCDGYTAPPAGSLPWGVLLRPQPSVSPAANNSELRGLAFFHQAVAPVLSGPFDASFWTHLVAQTTHHDDAARHAVLAISTLFENFAPMSSTRTPDNPLAIRHYNRAIQQLVKFPTYDVDTFLTVCILFICIEFLRGDGKAAINHTQHGLRILSACPGNSKLTAVFSHINLFPLFFGTKPEDFSVLTRQAPKPTGPFQSMVEAQHCLDIYIARALHLIMQSEGWKTGRTPHDTPTPAMMSERGKIVKAFEQWELTFAKFQARRSIDTNTDPASLGLKIRALTLRIWTLNCLTREEIVYDVLKPDFERIVDMATRLCSLGTQQSRFMFDTGSSPLLHFIALKCRFLRLRVAALAALKTLACPRESLWDSVLVYSVAKRVAEVEHGVEIGPDTLELIDNGTIKERVPPEEERVRVYRLEDEPENPPDDGKATYRRGVFFLMVAADGTTTKRHEWITLPKRLTFQAMSQKSKNA